MQSALSKLVNVDGAQGKTIMPYPHDAFHNPEVLKYDDMSMANRIEQIKDNLTPNERHGVESFVLLCSGGTLETTSFLEFLHWWALCGHTYEGCIELLVKYKFRGGQSSFAINFFNEALATEKLTYVFNCPVTHVKDTGNAINVTSEDGQEFQGLRLISAIPLHLLKTISFEPPLAQNKQIASEIGHVNQCIKVHAEIQNRDLRSWTGMAYPHNKLIYGFGDGTTPAGNTHVVCFGAQFNHFEPEDDVSETIKALNGFVSMDVEKLVRPRPISKLFTSKQDADRLIRCSTTGPKMRLPEVLGESTDAAQIRSI